MQSKTRLVQYLTGACAIWLLMAFTGGVAHWRQLAQDSARTSEQLVELLLMASELRMSGEAVNAETVAALMADVEMANASVYLERSDMERTLLSSGAGSAQALSPEGHTFRLPLNQGGSSLLVYLHHAGQQALLHKLLMYQLALFLLMCVSVTLIFSVASRRMRNELRNITVTLRQSRASVQQLGQRLLQLQDEERSFLARELHDEFGQNLTAVSTAAAFVERHAANGNAELLAECGRDIRLAAASMAQQVRGMLRSLRPQGLQGLGLKQALQDQVNNSRLHAEGVQLQVQMPSSLPLLSDAAALALYRTLQEALTNVLKHAQARVVRLVIEHDEHRLWMRIDDDGCGHELDVRSMARGGVTGMQERARAGGGSCEFNASVLGGICVYLSLPVLGKKNEGDLSNAQCAVA